MNAVTLQPRGPGGGRHYLPIDGGSVGGSKPGDGRKSLRHSKTVTTVEYARLRESLPHGGRTLATGSADSIPCDKTGAPAHAWAGTGHQEAAPRLSWVLSKEEQTEGPASCRGKETEQRGGTSCRPPRPPLQNPQPFVVYWETTILTLWGAAGDQLNLFTTFLLFYQEPQRGCFPPLLSQRMSP